MSKKQKLGLGLHTISTSFDKNYNPPLPVKRQVVEIIEDPSKKGKFISETFHEKWDTSRGKWVYVQKKSRKDHSNDQTVTHFSTEAFKKDKNKQTNNSNNNKPKFNSFKKK